MRVHELAKELGEPSKEFLAKIHDLGIEAKSHMSSLDDETVELIRSKLGSTDGTAATEVKEVPLLLVYHKPPEAYAA